MRAPGVSYEVWVGRSVGRRWTWMMQEVVR